MLAECAYACVCCQFERQNALANLSNFERLTPQASTVLALANSQVSMAIEPFLDVYDVDYQRYKTLQEWNAPAELVPDLARLKYYYGTHCIREQTGPIQAS
eukprot:jgi/Chrzof1/11771/Cz06g09110.t1